MIMPKCYFVRGPKGRAYHIVAFYRTYCRSIQITWDTLLAIFVGNDAQKFNSVFYIGVSVVIIISNVLETQQRSSEMWRIECLINGQNCIIGQHYT